MSVTWYKKLYVGQGMKKCAKRVRRQLDRGIIKKHCYVITLASNGVDCLDIIPSVFLRQKTLMNRLPMVVGLASSKDEAVDLVRMIAVDCLIATGDADIRG
ncbi:MAG: hypothetical protein Q4G47_08700, partial [Lachnospiraceae bacterium]|nr:hypothetical protein [Lachnospiraceae bacterium]